MKRGGPIARKTPLTARTPMKRSGGPSPARMPMKRTPMKQKRDEPRRRDIDTSHGAVTWQSVRLIIWTRAGGACELCGTSVSVDQMEGHHRRTRRLGPDCPGNAIALCRSCHHDIVHGQPEEAKVAGWIVSRFTDDPCSQPIRLRNGLVSLTCGGTYGLTS